MSGVCAPPRERIGAIASSPPPAGCRIVVELFPTVSPLACENFLRLCKVTTRCAF